MTDQEFIKGVNELTRRVLFFLDENRLPPPIASKMVAGALSQALAATIGKDRTPEGLRDLADVLERELLDGAGGLALH